MTTVKELIELLLKEDQDEELDRFYIKLASETELFYLTKNGHPIHPDTLTQDDKNNFLWL